MSIKISSNFKLDWFGEYKRDSGGNIYYDGDYWSIYDYSRMTYIIQLCSTMLRKYDIGFQGVSVPSKSVDDIVYAEDMTEVENAISTIAATVGVTFYPNEYVDGDYFWSYSRLNEMESVLVVLYNIIETKYNGKTPDILRRLSFRLSGGKF